MNFVGSKGGSGIAQWIISAMPYHRVYLELFLGKGIVFKTKLPAAVNIGAELDPKVISRYWRRHTKIDSTLRVIHEDAFRMLKKKNFSPDTLIYLDPPYLGTARSCKRRYYSHELLTVEDHKRLLSLLQGQPCMVMISGYWSELYASMLDGWRTSWKWTVNRRGKMVKEWLWMNFPEPALLHDTRFVGNDFTDRQRIKRKAERWKRKILSMPAAERGAVLDAIFPAGIAENVCASGGTVRIS